MDQNSKNYRELFSQLSTEDLEAFLQKDFESGATGNEEVILAILDILVEREDVAPTGKSVDQAWDEFQKYYNTPDGVGKSLYPIDEAEQNHIGNQKKARSWWRRGLAAAAAAVLLVVAVPYAIGSESVFTKIGKWSANYFGVLHPDTPATDPSIPFHSENKALEQVHQELFDLGVAIPLVPTWIPDELSFAESNVTEYPGYTKYYARFASDLHEVIITIDIPDPLSPRLFQKDDVDADELEVGGIKHYLVPNDGYWNAVWENCDIESSITTNFDKDVLIQIIRSIYSGGV